MPMGVWTRTSRCSEQSWKKGKRKGRKKRKGVTHVLMPTTHDLKQRWRGGRVTHSRAHAHHPPPGAGGGWRLQTRRSRSGSASWCPMRTSTARRPTARTSTSTRPPTPPRRRRARRAGQSSAGTANNFDIVSDHFSRISQLHPTPLTRRVPCSYSTSRTHTEFGADLVLGIRCCNHQFGAPGSSETSCTATSTFLYTT